ncbi:MaoC family dehydratase [Methylobacterium sp. J-068]|uniref:MaoC family dehydratase n=1 Tax=Methylobacterium sp. J-068 TaxID=2836649 RepID=UPI001FB99BC6|nr:MaoC family dehydratase [Methylobacterium sp. J-068]MCJ2035070.1 MaoC family dehydratase [Methylobacterium sp. J-068]
MTGIAFEDFVPGSVIEGGPLTVTEAEIVAFAAEFDPQPFHLDAEAAKATFVGHLIGSGWQTAGFGMRLLQEHVFRGATSMGSPGITELRWLRPVLPGDRLSISVRVETCRVSNSKPDRGFVVFAMTVLNGDGKAVMTQDFSVMFARRGAAPLPPRAVVPADDAPLAEATDVERLPFLEAAPIGTTRDLGRHRFTPEAITAFARAYDPQAFHLDPDAARHTHFGGLCASGWHTAAAWMKRLHITRERDIVHTARSGPVPQLGPSPGFRDMRWRAPVYAGDTIRYTCTLVDKRATASRPGWGLATHENTGVNQRGETVFAFTGTVFWQWSP